MKEFDLIVIGAGSGLHVADAAAELHSVAVVEEGPMGGTCLNRGCIPSKAIIHSADVAELVGRAPVFGILPKGYKVDFASVTKRASQAVDKDARAIERSIRVTRNMTLFKKRCRFVAERTLAVGNKKISGRKVVVAAGTRPSIPLIEGIEDVKYLTSDNAMRLTKQPKSMVVLGGGFIAAELAHFFGALGTRVTIVQRSVLLREEDREIADAFTRIFSRKHNVILGYTTKSASQSGSKITLTIESADRKKTKRLETDALLIATGRIPNTDLLDVKKGDIAVDSRGYVKVNRYLETTAPNTWALGDIVGKYLLKHSANLEAQYVWQNAFGKKQPVDYWPMPHAIFTSPQIAAVGYAEDELKEKRVSYAVGRYWYKDTGMGLALAEEDGFVKILADRKTHKILGCHIIGPEAASIIHEVIVAMRFGATAEQLAGTTHIHPATSEVVQRAAARVEW